MTPQEFTDIRKNWLCVSVEEMAILLRIKSTRAIRYYESGQREISGPIEVAIEFLQTLGPRKLKSRIDKERSDLYWNDMDRMNY